MTDISTFDRIYEIVKKIPRGRVATYGQVAVLAGNPRWSRVVGYALHSNPQPDIIPCFRVVMKDGSVSSGFAFGGGDAQRQLLEAEGVEFGSNGKVIMEKYRWSPELPL